MPRTAQIFVACLVGGGLLVPQPSTSTSTQPDDWLDIIRRKAWVTTFADSSDYPAVPAPIDRIVVLVGDHERVVYRAHVMDREIGAPVVSPDGTRIAFVKSDGLRRQIFVMTTDGGNLRPLVAIPTSALNIKGSLTSSPVAWTHDNQSLALLSRLEVEAPSPERRLGGPPKSLWRVNVATSEATRLRELDFRQVGNAVAGATLTPQGWAPDGRRLVYGNSDFRAIVLDTATGGETDLGPGMDPTWSPDGRFIAVRLPTIGEGRPGDYVVIDAEPPHRRTLLVSNAPTLFSWGGPRYLGDPIWLPDSDGVFLYRYRRLIGTPYIVRRTTGEATKMPFTAYIYSWGGKP